MLRHAGTDKWNGLFQLTLRLRSPPAGSDTLWVKNPRAARKREASWYQRNTQLLRQAQADGMEARDRLRAGRLQRWMEQGEQLRKSLQAECSQPETLELLGRSHQQIVYFHQVKLYILQSPRKA